LKAVLLAGGYGTRGRPFTDYIPKVMIPLDGRPVIDYVVRYLAKFSQVSEIIVICEFDKLGKQIINYFEGKDEIVGKPIRFVEDKKNGTGGALLTIERNVDADDYFLVWFADNLCALKINDLIFEYETSTALHGANITGVVTVRRRRNEETGRVVLDETPGNNSHSSATARVKQFIEKGEIKLENPEAVGIYLFTNSIFRYLHILADKLGSFNLSHDLLMHISSFGGNLYSFDMGDQTSWIDLESPSYADRYRENIMKILSQMNASI
jgi:mannose-1-phosphate guanylyltransferase